MSTVVVLVLCLALAAFAGWSFLRDQPRSDSDLFVAGMAELALLVYIVVRVLDLVGGHKTDGLGLVIGYLIGIALVLPIAVVLSLAERSKWGSVVLGVGGLTVCVLLGRIHQLWTPHA